MKKRITLILTPLSCIILLSLSITFLISGFDLSKSIDIQLHDTYLVIIGYFIFISLTFILSYISFTLLCFIKKLNEYNYVSLALNSTILFLHFMYVYENYTYHSFLESSTLIYDLTINRPFNNTSYIPLFVKKIYY